MTTTEYTTCCFPAARSPVDYCFKPCIRPDWCSKPGFWDPHAVTEVNWPSYELSSVSFNLNYVDLSAHFGEISVLRHEDDALGEGNFR